MVKMKEHWITPGEHTGVRLRWVGVLDFGELYRWMRHWLMDRGFCDERGFTEAVEGWTYEKDKESKDGKKSMEKKYIEIRQQGSKNLEIEWRLSSEQTNFFRWNLFINFLIIAQRDEEVEMNGVKRKLDQGDYELRLGAFVSTEFGLDDEKLPLYKKIYYKNFSQKRLEMQKRDLYILFYRFHSDLQDYIKNARY